MIYKNWMSYIKDDVKLCDVVMPGSHNTGSYGMSWTGCCQDGDIYDQFCYGVRHYCMRLDTKNGVIVQCHGVTKGEPFTYSLRQFRRIIEENDSEFLLIDLREYYPQKIGPITLKFRADPKEVDKLLAKYINPEKYAFTDFDDISKVTMGDIRRSGKRYIIINHECAYAYSVNCKIDSPWDKKIHGLHAPHFVKECLSFLDKEYEGLLWFQTQMTPNLGTDIGFRSPRKLDKALRPHFKDLIKSIASDPDKLKKANIIGGDFMTEDYMKSCEILMLNILKNNIIEPLKDEFKKGLTPA